LSGGKFMNNKVISFCDNTMEWCVYLLFFCLPFAKAGVGIFTVLGIAAWIGKRIAGFRSDGFQGMLPETPLQKALVVFFVVNAISVIFSADFALSFVAFFEKTIKFILIFFMVVETINTEKRFKKLIWIVLASAALIALDALAQYFNGMDFLKGYEFNGRLRASFSVGNGFAGWLIIILSFLLGLLADRNGRRWGIGVLLIALVLFLIPFLALTYSRGGWLGFMIALLAMMAYVLIRASFARRIFYLSVAAGLVVTFVILPKPVKTKINSICEAEFKSNRTLKERMLSVLNMKSGSIPIRFNLWRESLKIIKEDPLTGCGLNMYSAVARDYKSFEGGGIYPHNSYLQMAAETGLVGLASFMWMLFVFFRMSLIYLKQHKDYLMLGIVSGILGFLVQACFDTHLYSLQMVVLFWFMLGLGTAVIKMRVSSRQASRSISSDSAKKL